MPDNADINGNELTKRRTTGAQAIGAKLWMFMVPAPQPHSELIKSSRQSDTFMQSEGSDLTDLSTDESVEQSRKSKDSKKKKTGYRLRNVLRPGRTTQYTAKALYDQIHENDIDLDPEYQRDVVWSEAKQIGLIDSLFRNFYIPPIIFSVTTEDDGTEKRVCIDGKQRLTSIQNFIGGSIPHRDPFTNERLWFVDSTSGPKRKLLPPQYKTLFQNKQIVCIEYSDLPPELEREVFQRVQMGMALTTAEKMQAISGPWPDLVREITNEYYLCRDGISDNMDLNHARARDFQNLAQTIYCIDQLPNQVHGTTMQIEKWLAREDEPSAATRQQLHDVFKIFRDIARHKELKVTLKKPSRVAPAEFIMIGIMIAMYKERLSLPQLSQAIGILRSETRAAHADIRTNGSVFKTMFQVVNKQIKPSNLTDTPGLPTAGSASGDVTVKNNGKRKRDDNDEERSNGAKGRDEYVRQPREPLRSSSPKSHAPSAPRGVSNNEDISAHVRSEGSRPAVSSATVISTNSRVSHGPSTGPSRFARIQAAKAQAAMMGNTTGSGASSVTTPQSILPQQLQPHIPFLESPQQQAANLLEAAMMGTANQQIDSSTSAPPNTTRNATPPLRHNHMQPIPISIPVTANHLGAPPMDNNYTIDRQGQDRFPGVPRDDDSFNMHRGYNHDQQNHVEQGYRGSNSNIDRGRDFSQGSSSNRHPLPRRPDGGWGQRGGRGGSGYRT